MKTRMKKINLNEEFQNIKNPKFKITMGELLDLMVSKFGSGDEYTFKDDEGEKYSLIISPLGK